MIWPASLHIGEITPYEVQSYNMGSSGGTGANMQVEKEETGIKINMEPHVNDNNQVTITVEPEVSNIIGFVGQNKDLPQVQVRKTKTSALRTVKRSLLPDSSGKTIPLPFQKCRCWATYRF